MSKTAHEEARDHIERIEAGYVPKSDDAISKALTDAIDVLSDELYGNATHFIQEILQNSDDNSFECSKPTVTFTYRPGCLRVDCNEKGFSSANVDAICAIRSSTKVGNSDYTGEKGIGFKSVFRAADVVWVASREYRFKFDRNQRFGILSPTWAEFPEQEPYKQDHTSFYLKLSPKFDQTELVKELHHFDPAQLVFMRRLKKIQIRIYHTQNTVIPWEQTIHRADSEDGSITTLNVGASTQQYLIQKYELTNLPSGSKRPDSTKLVFAFPITDVTVELPYHKVYAGLPIKEVEMFKVCLDTGYACLLVHDSSAETELSMQFLLHGDFVLTASRSDIDASLLWNRKVRDGLPDVLLEAIKDLRKCSLRHAWPDFLICRKGGFFDSAIETVMKRLRREKCLESSSEGHMDRPAHLKYVGKKFCDAGGQPFTLSPSTATRYLCTSYSPMAIEVIRTLGVPNLTPTAFLRDLQKMISEDAINFQSRSSDWHAELCKTLLSFVGDPTFRDRLAGIPIIPLSNGRWVASSDSPKPVLERGDIELDDFQVSDIFPTVNQSATTSHHRKALFTALGIEPIDTSQLCQRVWEQHSSEDFDPEKWSTSHLIAHAKLLYVSNWSPRAGEVDLWFATSRDGRCKGSKLYLKGDYGEKKSPAVRILDLIQQAFPIIHPDYLRSSFHPAPNPPIQNLLLPPINRGFRGFDSWLFPIESTDTCSEDSWRRYLMERLHVSQIPRLVDITAVSKGKKTFVLSDDFKYIFKNGHVADVISTINSNWNFYSQWIDPDTSQQQSEEDKTQTAQLVSTIGDTIVTTLQRPSPLRMTFIPGLDDHINATMIPTLDLKLPVQKSLRHRLGIFGVTVDNDLSFYLACLRALKDQHSPDIDTIAHIYEQIQYRLDDEEDTVVQAFNEEALIYIGPMLEKTSRTTEVWTTSGDDRARRMNIQGEYTRSRRLFTVLFESAQLTLHQLIQEGVTIDQSWTNTQIIDIMGYINQYLKDRSPKGAAKLVKPLRSRSIFPVSRSEKGAKSTSEVLLSAENENWFIADRPHLRDSFLGKTSLLSFHPNDIAKIDNFLKALGLERRKLSVAAKSQKFAQGELKFDTPYTIFFRKRSRFIQELVPRSNSRQENSSLCQQIDSVRVSMAAEIYESYSFKSPSSEITGRPCRSEVACSATGDHLQIFVAARFRTPWQCPTASIISMISDHFGIKDNLHMDLLWTTFIERDTNQVQQAFAKQGIRTLKGRAYSVENSTTNTHRWIRSGDVITVPSPPSDGDSSDDTREPGSGSRHRSIPYQIRYRRDPEKKLPVERHKRRLPLLFSPEKVREDNSKDDRTNTNLDLEFIGEHLISHLFESELGYEYVPVRHWTSSLRARSGLCGMWTAQSFDDDKSPFTLTGRFVTPKMTDFLIRHGIKKAVQWQGRSDLRYHCEVAVTTSGIGEEFSWTSKKIDRARAVQLHTKTEGMAADVMVMIRIGHIYSNPVARVLLDPWNLLLRGHMEIILGSVFHAIVLRGNKSDPVHYGDDISSKKRPLVCDGSTRNSSGGEVSQKTDWAEIEGQAGKCGPGASNNSSTLPVPYTYPNSTFGQDLLPSSTDMVYGPTTNRMSLPPSSRFQEYCPPRAGAGPLPNTLSLATDPRLERDTSTFGSGYEELSISNIIDVMGHVRLVRFPYRQLNTGEIRLFTLFPGKGDDDIKGMIQCVMFKDIRRFYALSYLWGDEIQPTHKVLTPEGFLCVSTTLQMNLARLRREDEPLVIWIDAICINQKDPQEKSEQIQLLPRVFQRADCTFAILGSGSWDNEAIQMLLQVEALREFGRDSEDWPNELEMCPTSWGPSGTPSPEDPVWARVVELFNDAWFRRVWIVQEAVASPVVKVVCGKHVALWDDISGAVRHIDSELGERLPLDVKLAWKPFETLDQLRNWEARTTRWSVLLLLETFRYVKSTLARDRLFALLGISCDGDLNGFTPDYIAPFEQVVLSFARALVDAGMGIKLLYRAGIGSCPERFPSWVPDWTIPKLPGLYEARDRGLIFNAGGNTKQKVECQHGGPRDEIIATGYYVDRIRHVSKRTNTRKEWKVYFDEIDHMVDSLDRVPPIDRDRFKRDVPIAGAQHPQVACSQTFDIEKTYKAFRKVLKKSQWTKKYQRKKCSDGSTFSRIHLATGPPPEDELGLSEKSEVYESLLCGTLEGWRFVVTDGNRCGIAPPNVAIGNHIIILRGGEVPFLLMDSQDRENAHRLVGECYVADIMFGEVFESDNVVENMFRIY